MSNLWIPEDWAPTPAAVKALPLPIRRYIAALQSARDPDGTIRALFELRAENKALRQRGDSVAAQVPRDWRMFFPKPAPPAA